MKYIIVVDTLCKILKALNKHLEEVARTQESPVNDQEDLGLCDLVCVCDESRGRVRQVKMKKKVVGRKKEQSRGEQ